MHLGKFVAVGDIGQYRAPHHHRQAEPVVGLDRRDRRDRAIVRDRRNDAAVGACLGRRLHRDVRLAFVIEHQELVFVFRIGIGVAELDREISRVAAAQPVSRGPAGERADEGDLDLVLGGDGQRQGCQHSRERDGEERCFADHGVPLGGAGATCCGAPVSVWAIVAQRRAASKCIACAARGPRPAKRGEGARAQRGRVRGGRSSPQAARSGRRNATRLAIMVCTGWSC